jgi:hypothetical protein
MSMLPDEGEKRAEAEADNEASAMKDQLSKDVASWSAARSDGSARDVAEFGVPPAKQSTPQTVKRVRRPKPALPEAKPASTGKKPFSMSYDGVTEADYITYMIARGAR